MSLRFRTIRVRRIADERHRIYYGHDVCDYLSFEPYRVAGWSTVGKSLLVFTNARSRGSPPGYCVAFFVTWPVFDGHDEGPRIHEIQWPVPVVWGDGVRTP